MPISDHHDPGPRRMRVWRRTYERASGAGFGGMVLYDRGDRMTDADKGALYPATATAAEVETTLPFALRYAGRQRVHSADDVMARVTAERLVQHLDRSGYVILKRPAMNAPSTSGHRHSNSD